MEAQKLFPVVTMAETYRGTNVDSYCINRGKI